MEPGIPVDGPQLGDLVVEEGEEERLEHLRVDGQVSELGQVRLQEWVEFLCRKKVITGDRCANLCPNYFESGKPKLESIE